MESFRLANATPPIDFIRRCLVKLSSLIHLSESSESESLLRRSSWELVDKRSTMAMSLAAVGLTASLDLMTALIRSISFLNASVTTR